MKKIAFLINKKIIYVDYQITTNKNAYLKITRNNKLLITGPNSISQTKIVKVFGPRIQEFLDKIKRASNNILYSLDKKFVFWNGQKLKLEFLTGYLKNRIKITNKTFYLMTASGDKNVCEKLLKSYFNHKMRQYVLKKQPFFEKKMTIFSHQIKVSYKFATWASNNLKLHIINYSSRLIHFDTKTIDYVIVHELAHARVPNHSLQFYNEIAKVIPNYREYQNQLRQIPCDKI